MKLKANPITIHSTKNISKKDIFKKVLNNNYSSKNRLTDVINYRNLFLNQNNNMWKTFFNFYKNNETSKKNMDIYYNYNIHKSIINLNNIKEKSKTKRKRPFHSAFLIKKVKTINNENKLKKSILPSSLGKKINLLLEKNKENNNINNSIYTNLNSTKNLLSNQRNTYNISAKFFKLNKESCSSIIEKKNNMNKSKIALVKVYSYKNKRNKNDLIPYPFKRLQNKIRRYFSLSRNVRLSEEQLPYFYLSHLQLNNAILDSNRNNSMIFMNKNNNNIQNVNHKYNNVNKYNRDKNNIKSSNKENTKKVDKSINTENSIFNKNINDKALNEIQKKFSSTPYFKNQIIGSKTSSKGFKFFITTSTNKDKKDTKGKGDHTHKGSILVYKFN